jgi:hypothetical protein
MKKFLEFFTDGTSLSMMRLTQFMVVAVILAIFIYRNIAGSPAAIIDFPPQCVALIAIVIAGKVIQSFSEGQDKNG